MGELRSNNLIEVIKCGLRKVQHSTTKVVQLLVLRVESRVCQLDNLSANEDVNVTYRQIPDQDECGQALTDCPVSAIAHLRQCKHRVVMLHDDLAGFVRPHCMVEQVGVRIVVA